MESRTSADGTTVTEHVCRIGNVSHVALWPEGATRAIWFQTKQLPLAELPKPGELVLLSLNSMGEIIRWERIDEEGFIDHLERELSRPPAPTPDNGVVQVRLKCLDIAVRAMFEPLDGANAATVLRIAERFEDWCYR